MKRDQQRREQAPRGTPAPEEAPEARTTRPGRPQGPQDLLQMQRTVGNRATTRALQRRPGAGRADSVIQRVNQFYGSGPKYTMVPNPLTTISESLGADLADLGMSASKIVSHWRSEDTLKIAKTYRTMLTNSSHTQIYRPDEASAWIDTPNPNPGKRKDPSWITGYGNLGSVEDQIRGETVQSYNGGHLIAWEFLNEKANQLGNIAPQAEIQNQALFRRIERTVEDTIHGGGNGVEVTVKTPYRQDNYQVTYEELFDRGVLKSQPLKDALTQKGLLKKQLTLAQMAPDTYDVYMLTQTNPTSVASKDAREDRNNIPSYKLENFQADTASALMAQHKPPALSILASNYNPTTIDQEAAAFAHMVFLNYRSLPGELPQPPQTSTQTPGGDHDMEEENAPTQEQLAQLRQLKLQRALQVIQKYQQLAGPILEHLIREYGMGPTEAERALIEALMESEWPG